MKNFRRSKSLLLAALAFMLVDQSHAQLVLTGSANCNAFLQGKFVEVGVNGNAAFGSSVAAPSGYHPKGGTGTTNPCNSTTGPGSTALGFVADPQKDGWTVGGTPSGYPNYIGDYFLPGSPFEGWTLNANGTELRNWNGISNAMTGNFTGYTNTGSHISATWNGSGAGLAITQVTSLDTGDLYFYMNVTLTNTTGSTISNVYYGRDVDPDNEVEEGGTYTTKQNIDYQLPNTDNDVLVSATGLNYGSYLGLGTRDCRAKCFYNQSSLSPTDNLPQIYAQTVSQETFSGTYTQDAGIGLVFSLGNIAPGASVSFAYAYILDSTYLTRNAAFTKTSPTWSATGDTSASQNSGDTAIVCQNQFTTVTIPSPGAYTWNWTAITGETISPTTNSSYTTLTTGTTIVHLQAIGTQTVTGTCTLALSDTLDFFLNPQPIPGITGTLNVCMGSTTTLSDSRTGGTWVSGSTGVATIGSSSGVVTPVSAGTSTVTYTTPSGCMVTAIVTVNALPTITPTAGTVAICGTGPVAIGASGATTYTWSPGGTLSATTGSSVNANPTSLTVYTVTGTNSIGCANKATVTVSVNPLPTVSAGSNVTICSGNNTTLNASGASTYTWSPATNLSATVGASVTANPTATTIYTVAGTSSSGCTNTATVIVSVNTTPTMAFTSPVNTCDSQVTLAASSSSYSGYSWSTGATTSSINVKLSGTYSYTVTNNGCPLVGTASVTVVNGHLRTANLTICAGTTVTLNASPFTPSFDPSAYSPVQLYGGHTYYLSNASTTWAAANTAAINAGGHLVSITSSGENTFVSGFLLTGWIGYFQNHSSPYYSEPAGGWEWTTGEVSGYTNWNSGEPNNAGGDEDWGEILSTGKWNDLDGTGPLQYVIEFDNQKTYSWSNGATTIATTVNPLTTTTYYCTSTLNGVSCTDSVVVTVNPNPTVTTSGNVTICSGNSTTLTASGASTYSWLPTTSLSPTTGSSVSANPTSNIIYTVTGTNTTTGCTNTATAMVSVNTTPVATVPANQTVCNGATVGASSFSSSVGGTTYAWTNSNTSIGLASSGTANPIPSFTAINSGTVTAVAVIAVTPTANSCPGAVQSFTVNVLPTPTINIIPATQTVCNTANTSTINFSSTVTGTTYAWSNSNTSVGIGASGSGSSIASVAAINTGTVTSTAVFTVTPTAATCLGAVKLFTVNVSPTPTINVSPATQTVCNTAPTSTVNFSSTVTGTTYNWANNNTTIGIGAAGAGSAIASFTATNTSAVATGGVFTVTPTYATCIGAVQTFTVNVSPTPTINVLPATQTVCNLSPTTTVNFSSSVTGTTYTWANSNTSIGIGATGAGPSVSSFTGTNTGTVTATGIFTVTPTAATCLGAVQLFTVNVSPTPTINVFPSNVTVCNNTTAGGFTFGSTAPGTTFNWTNSNTSIGLAASGSGNIAAFTAVNTGTVTATSVIAVTPIFAGCPGAVRSFTINVSPTPVATVSPNTTVCNGGTAGAFIFTSSVPGTTFNWTNTTPSIGLGSTGTGTIPAFTTINTGTATVSAVVTVTSVSSAGCIGAIQTFTISVSPSPAVTVPASSTVCNNTTAGAFSFSSAVAGTTYAWSNSNPSIGLAASGSGAISAFTAINTGSVTATAVISVTPTAATCAGTAKSFTVNVTPSPVVTVPATTTVCNGATAGAFSFSSTLSGTTYTWTNSNTSIGLGASGSGATIAAFTATNSGTAATTAVIAVTPTATCPGVTHSFTVNVSPTPIAVVPANETVCNNTTAGAFNFSSAVAGTTYTWTNSNPSIGLGASGSGNITAFTAINTGTVTATAVISVTPTAAGCPGSVKSFTVNVLPTPSINVLPATQTVCNTTATSAVNFSSTVTGTTYTWANSNTTIGIGASGAGSSVASFTGTNAGTVTTTGVFTVTPTAATCVGAAQLFTVNVSPTPIAAVPANATVCNNTAAGAYNFSSGVAGTTYTWTNSNTSIGLAASGSGNISAFTAINTGTLTATAVIAVTPTAASCPGAVQSFTVNVSPTPSINVLPATQTVCNTTATSPVNFSSTVSGTTYTWVNSNTTIGIGASGAGSSVASFTGTNTGTVTATGIFTVTPIAATCVGAIQLFTVNVSPTPIAMIPVNSTVCNNSTAGAFNFRSTVAGTTYAWTNSNTSIGLAASGSGNIAPFTAVNTGTVTTTAVISMTPTAAGCPGATQSFTVTVSPSPTINVLPVTQTVCNATATSAVNFSSTVTGTTYTWANSNTTIGIGASGSGSSLAPFTGINSGTVTATGVFTVTPVAATCVGAVRLFTVNISPSPVVIVPANATVCNNATAGGFNFSSAVTGTTYTWTNSNTSIGLAASGSGNIAAFTATNTGSVTATAVIAVTPTAAGCPGAVQSFTVNVSPTPTINVLPATQTVCNTTATTPVNFSSTVTGTTYTWTNNNISIGIGASGSGSSVASFTAANTGTVTTTGVFTVTPTAATCPGAIKLFTVNVLPTPAVTVPANATVCNNATAGGFNFSSAVTGTTYTWTNSNTSIGLAASGSGNIAAFTATNTGSVTATAVIAVTPTAAGCPGAVQSFTVNVSPTPTINVLPATQTVCNTTATSAVNFSSTVTGTTYTWTNNNISIGIGASGSGSSLAPFTGINGGTVTATGVFTVTPTAATCIGAAQLFTVNVSPTPTINVLPVTQTVCNTTATSAVNFSSSVTGTTYTWSNNNTTIGIGASGSGSSLASFTGTNSGTVTATGIFTVTPTAATCMGAVKSFTVNVLPTPIATVPASQVFCSNTTAGAFNFSSTVTGTTYTWTNSNTTIGLGASGSGNIAAFTAVNTSTVTTTAVVSVTPTAATCPGAVQSFSITVNPLPIISAGSNVAICIGNNTMLTGTGGATYSWSPSTGLSSTTGTSVVASPTVTTTYTVTGTGAASGSATFNYTGAIQTYTVPAGVTSLTIAASGAQGGNQTSYSTSGGAGANMGGTFTTTPGHVLNILVGQHPAAASNTGGGGGGSFVWDVTAGNALLIAAGGGGGAGFDALGTNFTGIDAVTTNNGTGGGGGYGGAGTGGNGGTAPTGTPYGDYGAGGTGWFSNGAGGIGGCSNAVGGATPLTGGAGGTFGGTAGVNGSGGFGGGGGSQGICSFVGGGGGGGYSGGAGGVFDNSGNYARAGGGGGSYNIGSSQFNSVGNTGNGIVTISYSMPACSNTATVTVTVNPLPTVSATAGATAVCSGSPTTLTASGAVTYTWSPSATLSASTGTSVTATPVSATTYTVVGTSIFGCVNTGTVTVNTLAVPAAITGIPIVCVETTSLLSDATTGGTWTSSSIPLATVGATGGLLTGYGAGNPTITYTLPDGCIATVIATVNPLPDSTFTISPAGVCLGASSTFAAVTPGATLYSWNYGDGTTATGVTTVHTYSVAGVYTSTLTVTNSFGCNSQYRLQTTVNALPVAISGTASVCLGLTTMLSDATGTGHWSSSATGTATVGSSSGLVTGIAAGNATIVYTASSGCTNTVVVTVNPLPAAIGSLASVCPGSSVTLTDASTGGTWASSNTAIATVVGSTGTVTGVASGPATITYTLPTGCMITAPQSVNPLPAPISGVVPVCVTASITLGDGSAGGSWSSGSPSVATIGTSGSVLGVSGGTSIITYTLPTTCAITATVTVNALPNAITGTPFVCVGSATTLATTSTGGTWSSSNTLQGTVSTTGTVTGIAAGTPFITYTLPTGCFINTPVTVSATPAAIAGTNNVCAGSTTTLTDATTGGTWSSSNTALGTVNTTGVVAGIANGTLNISYTSAAGCGIAMPFTVNITPTGITGTTSVCATTTTTLSSTPSGGTWTSSNPSFATVVSGTGVVTGVGAGIPVITYTLAAGGCKSVVPVTVLATPAAIAGSPNVCAGSSTTLTDATGSGSWTSGATGTATIGLTSGVMNGVAAGATTITYTATTGCNSFLNVTVNASPAAITGSGNVCLGTANTLSNTVTGGAWTSSNTAVATVTSGGSVSGVAAGNATITYTLSPGACIATLPVTVNNIPAAIAGNNFVCSGLTTALSDATAGGSWSSSLPANASVGTGTGVVSGIIAGGTTTITYTLASGCTATLPMSVNLQPAALTGAMNVCTTLTTALGETTTGGTWSSSNPTLGSVSTTGVVTGIASGTPVISYTLLGCSATQVVTVNPNPSAITGASAVCATSTVTMSDATTGGVWSSSAPATGSIAAVSGVVTGIAAGNTTITYTLAAGCTATKVVSVNALPNLYAITGSGSYCAGGAGIDLGLASSDAGVSYQLFNGATAVGTALTGAGSSLDFGFKTTAGSYTVVATNPATGCTRNMSGTSTIIINSLPSVYTVTGGGGYCAGGTGVHVGLNNSNIGISYQLFNSGVSTGLPLVAGTGIAIDFGIMSTAGTYTVVATNTVTACASNMGGSTVVSVNPLPTAYTVTGGGGYCLGSTGVHIGLNPSDAGVSYQLFRGTVPVGTALGGSGSAIDFGVLTTAGTYTVFATNTTTGCTNTMTGSAIVSVNALPAAFVVSGVGGYCPGSAGSVLNLSGSVTGVTYQLMLSGSVVTTMAGTGSGISFPAQTTTGTYTVVAVSGSACNSTMTGSLTISVNPLPTAFSVTGGGGYCAGTTAGVHLRLSGSSPATSYQLYNGSTAAGTPVVGTGSALDFGAFTAVGTYTVSATSSVTACSNAMTGSQVVTINPLPAPFTMSASGAFCTGGAGIDVQLLGSATGVSYQLYRGTTPVGAAITGTGSNIDYGNQTVSGVYTVIATVNATTCTSAMTGSTTVTANPLPTAFALTGGGGYCAGSAGVHVGLAGSTAGVSYSLINAGTTLTTITSTGGPIDFGIETATGSYTVTALSPAGCTATMPGSVSVTLNALPTVYTVGGGGSYCAGSPSTVSVTLSGATAGISYQLYYGTTTLGTPITGTSALNFGIVSGIGTYSVSATNITTGCAANMTGSVSVTTNPLPTQYPVTVGSGGLYCAGGAGVPVGVSTTTSGTTYQLYRNGVIVTGASVLSVGTPISYGNETLTGTYSVIATSGAGCTNGMAGTVIVTTNPLPTAFTITGGGGYCTGTTTGVHVTLSGSNTGINYQLYNSGTGAGTYAGSGSAIDFGALTATGTYTAIAVNPVTTCSVNMFGTAIVTTNALPTAYAMGGGGSYCAGGTGVAVTLANSQTGVTYQLYNGASPSGTALAGATGSSLNFGLRTAGSYTVIATNGTSCTQVMTGTVSVSATSLPTAFTVTGGGNYCSGSGGVAIGLAGSVVGTTYQLSFAGSPTGPVVSGTGSGISFGAVTTTGTYTVMATGACSGAMAGSVNVGVNPLPTMYTVSGGGNYCAGGTGVLVGLTGSQTGVNYQLVGAGIPVGAALPGTGIAIDFGMQTAAGAYTVIATDMSTACADTTGSSVAIGINTPPASYLLSGGNSYCAGGTGVTLTLSNTTAGVNYQAYNGSVMTGAIVAGTGTPLNFGPYTATGIYTVIATDGTTTCTTAMTGSDTIRINTLPVVYTVTGGGNYCAGGTGVHVGLSSSVTGVSYQLYNSGGAVGLPVAGTGAALDLGLQTAADVYTVVAQNGAGCTANMSGSAVIAINAAPAAQTITGGGGYCAGTTGVHIGLAASDAGISYQLLNGSSPAGAAVSGTSAAIDFGLKTAVGNYKVTATSLTTGCMNTNSTDSVIVSVAPLPAAYTVTASAASFCAGGTGVHVYLGNGDATVNYQLYNGTVATGTAITGSGALIDFGPQTAAGIYTVMATGGAGCTSEMTGRAAITINPAPTVFSVTGGGNYCTGGTGAHIGITGSQVGTAYQLTLGGSPVGSAATGSGSVLDLGLHTAAGTYSVVATNTTGCVDTMTGTATIGISTLPVPQTVTGGGSYCSGSAGVPVGLATSATGTKYQLYNGSSAVGGLVSGTGSALSLGTETAAGTYAVTAVSDTTGCSNNMTGTAIVGINPLPGTYSITGGGAYCSGSTGVHIGLSGSHTGITYQLMDTTSAIGSPVAGTGLPVDFGAVTATGHYTIVATNATTTCTVNMTGTTGVSVNALPAVYTITGGGNYCAGTAGSHIGLDRSASGIVYQLHIGSAGTGSPVTGTGGSIDFGAFTTVGTYMAIATNSSTGCSVNMTGTATVSVNPTVVPAVSISTGTNDTVCSGTRITFTATPVNGGATPAYVWAINGVPVTSDSAYTYLPNNGDVVSVTLTSSALCPAPATANSTVAMTVLPQLMPSVTTTADPGTVVCQGTPVTFTATVANGGSAPAYVWKLNGGTVTGATNATYTVTPANTDDVFCVVTSSYQCPVVATVASTHTTMEVDVAVSPIVTLTVNPGLHIAQGQSVVFTANVTNGVSGLTYQWYINNGIVSGANSQVFITNQLLNMDSVRCIATTTGSCGGLTGTAAAQVSVSNVGVKVVSAGSDDIMLVPNPNQGTFTIKGTLGNTAAQEVTLEITDMLGQAIYTGKVAVHNGAVNEKIQLGENIANGMYLLNLRTDEGNKVFHMVIEQ